VLLRGDKIERPISAAAKKRLEAAAQAAADPDDRAKRASMIPPLGKKNPTPEPA